VRTKAARKLGATREEIVEAVGVAVAVSAGASLVYSTRTLDAFDAAQAEANPAAEQGRAGGAGLVCHG
jgi:alkylhydroperoxidase/carboxymuconolactone decarboxylase family protein YurZ